ncbi:hypothetical protein V8E36_009686 [Tilletia maclaganii]
MTAPAPVLFRGGSPGADATLSSTSSHSSYSVAPRATSAPSTSRSSSAGSGSAAAARLSSRFGRLSSIAQGKTVSGSSASSSTATTSQVAAQIRPIPFKNGITLVKDRRLIGQPVRHRKKVNTLFEAIIEQARLRVRPVIDRMATALQVNNLVLAAFIDQGHDLVKDGWNGYEYGYVTGSNHVLMTLVPTDKSIEPLDASTLSSEFGSKRDCYIIVRSNKKFPPYDPLFFELADVIDDEDDDDPKGKSKGKTKAKATISDDVADGEDDFTPCIYCKNVFSVDLIHDHEDSFYEQVVETKPSVHVKSEVKLEVQDIDDEEHLAALPSDVELQGDERSDSDKSKDSGDEEGNNALPWCACGKPDSDEDEMVGCDGPGCGTWWHFSCADGDGYINDIWYCKPCRSAAAAQAHSSSSSLAPAQARERNNSKRKTAPLMRATSPSKRSSSRLMG